MHLLPHPTTDELPSLTTEQKAAVDLLMAGTEPLSILTGGAGTGKSHVIRHMKQQGLVTVSATTGRAALNAGGITVDLLFCISRENWQIWNDDLLARYMEASKPVIVVDEGSMAGYQMTKLLTEIARAYDKRLILVGDWAQAAPVKDEFLTTAEQFNTIPVVKLTETHRQHDRDFIDALNSCRTGTLTQDAEQLFRSRCCTPDDTAGLVRIMGTKKAAYDYNLRALTHLGNPVSTLTSRFLDLRKNKTKARDDRFIRSAKESSNLADELPLALESEVVITMNVKSLGVVNGDTGVVTELLGRLTGRPVESPDEEVGAVMVLLHRGLTVKVEPVVRETKDPYGNVTHSVTGFPLDLGWAVTIHKSQGMTLDKVWFGMSTLRSFPTRESIHGLAYVALSRARTKEGLFISGFDPALIYCDERVKRLL